jgi:hypothetical protein
MKSWNTLILVLVAAALFVAIRWYETAHPGTREADAKSRQVVPFERENIAGITLTRGDEVVELKKRGRRWEIVSPLVDRADPDGVEQLLSELEFLKSGEVIDVRGEDAKKRFKEFGVNRPKLRVKLHGEGAPAELGIGKETAVSGRFYARMGDQPRVHVIPDALKKIIIRKAEAFRGRRLSDIDVGEVEKVIIKKNGGELVLERPEARWNIAKPLRARADDQKVADVVAKLATLPILEFCGQADKATAVHGFEEPRATVSVYAENIAAPAIFEIGGPVPGKAGAVYVRYADRGGFYEVPSPPVEELLDLEPNDLRDRQLLRLQVDVVDRIRIRPAEKPEVLLARRGEDWVLLRGDKTERPADRASVERMVAALQQRKVERFVEGTVDLRMLGLAAPGLEVVFSSYASENTPETTSGERPFLKLQIGSPDGERLPARVAEEDFVVMVGADLLEQIPTRASEWQTPELFRFDPDDVTVLKIGRAEGQDFTLKRERGGEWKIEEGAGVLNGVATESLLNTVAALRAVRWLGPESPAHGLAKPAILLEFRLANGQSGTLRMGGKGPDGTRFGTVSGLEGVAALSGPDVSALEAELLTTPGASPTPSP